jgi:hypothetical protein
MSEGFIFKTNDELASCRSRLFTEFRGHNAYKEAAESLQTVTLLEALAATSLPQYPVHVKLTPNSVPDVHFWFGSSRIAVELTRIESIAAGKARALQIQEKPHSGGSTEIPKRLRTTLIATNLLDSKKNPKDVSSGFDVPSFPDFGQTEQIQCEQWKALANRSLDKKTQVIKDKQFVHGDEDWLVLWDRFGIADVPNQPWLFSDLLLKFWKPGWFSRAFLQAPDFGWQMFFTEHDSSLIATKKESGSP